MLLLRKCRDKAQTGKTYSHAVFIMECYQTYRDNSHKSKIKRQQVVNGQNFKIVTSQKSIGVGFLSPVST